MTPAALWVTWTQPHKIITTAISNYQSQLMQSACFTLHNGPIIGFLYLSVSLWQLISQWNRCMRVSGTNRLKNRLVLWMVTLCGCESALIWFCFFFQCCSMQDLLRIRSEVSPHLSVHACSDQLASHSSCHSYWGSCERWAAGGTNPPPDPSHFYRGLLLFQHPSAPADASGCLSLMVRERCCVRSA